MNIARRITGRLGVYKRQGLLRSARIAVDQAGLGLLRRHYGFAPWHSQSPISARPYRKGVADMASSVGPNTVVEVGCGLGAILSRVKAGRRVGYDVDAGAIGAARLLHRGRIEFRVGSFDDVEESAIDVLVAVNWIHEFPPAQLEQWLVRLLPRTRYLLVDAIERASPVKYDYYHDFAFLEGRARQLAADSFGEAHRAFLLFEVG